MSDKTIEQQSQSAKAKLDADTKAKLEANAQAKIEADAKILEKNKNVETQKQLETIKQELDVLTLSVAETKKTPKAVDKKNIQEKIKSIEPKIQVLKDNTKLTEEEKKSLAGYEKELADLKAEISSGWEKAWDWTTDKAGKGWGWVKEHPIATAGIGLALVGLRNLFKSDDKKESSGDGKDEKKSRWKKALTWLGIGTGAYTLIDRLMSGKWRWEKDPDATTLDALGNIEDANKAFEKLDITKKEEYNTYGKNINDFYTSIYKFNDGTIPSGANSVSLGAVDGKLDNQLGVIPYVLDNSFASIADMNSEVGLFKLDNDADVAEVSKQIAELIGKGCGKLAGWILGTLGWEGILDPNNIEKQVTDFLSTENKLEETKLIFRKMLKVVTFTNYAENVIIKKKVETVLQKGGTLYKKGKRSRDESDDNWEVLHYDKTDPKLIQDIVSHSERYKLDDVELVDLKTEVRSRTIAELSHNNFSVDTIWQANKNIKEQVDTYNTERDKNHKSIETDKNGTLDKMKGDAEDQVASAMLTAQQTIPLFHLFDFGGGASEGAKDSLKKSAGFKDVLQEFTAEFEKLKGESDLKVIKKKIDMYYLTLKEISVAEMAMDEIVDENGNIGARCVWNVKNFFVDSYKNITYGFLLIGDAIAEGSIMTGLEGGLWVASGALPFYFTLTRSGRRLAVRGVSAASRTALNVGIQTVSVVSARASLGSGRQVAEALAQSGLGRWALRRGMFGGESGKNLFKYYYLTGSLSTDAANKLVSHAKRKGRATDVFQYLKDISVIRDSDHVKFLQLGFGEGRDYISNKSFRNLLFKRADTSLFNKMFSPQSIPIDIDPLVFEQLGKFEKKCSTVGKTTKQFLDDFVKHGSITNLDELKNVVSNIDKLDEAQLVGKNADELSAIFNELGTSMKEASFVGIKGSHLVPDVANVHRIERVLDDALTAAKNTLAFNKRTMPLTSPTVVNAEINVAKLEKFYKNIGQLDSPSLKLFDNILVYIGSSEHAVAKAVRILELLGESEDGLVATQRLLGGHVDEFVVFVKSSRLFQDASIGDEVLEGFTKGIKLASSFDEAEVMLKGIVKILSKI